MRSQGTTTGIALFLATLFPGALTAAPVDAAPATRASSVQDDVKLLRYVQAGPSGAKHGYWLENLTKQFGGLYKGD